MPLSAIQYTPGTGGKILGFERTEGANTGINEGVIIAEQYLAEYTVATLTAVSTATANSHVLQIMAGASNRLRIRRIEIYQAQMATTVALMQTAIYRLTTAGTGGTAITPQLLDPADAAAGATAMTLPTVKGTEGALLWAGHLYMMQTLAVSSELSGPRLVLDFDGLRRKPIHVAAGTSNGIAIKNITAVAGALVSIDVWLTETSFI